MDQGGMKKQLTQIQKLMQVYDPELYTYLGTMLLHSQADPLCRSPLPPTHRQVHLYYSFAHTYTTKTFLFFCLKVILDYFLYACFFVLFLIDEKAS